MHSSATYAFEQANSYRDGQGFADDAFNL